MAPHDGPPPQGGADEDDIAFLIARLGEVQTRYEDSYRSARDAQAEIARLQAERDAAEAARAGAEARLQAVLGSRSWRLAQRIAGLFGRNRV